MPSLTQALGRVPMGWWVVLLTLPALVPLARGGLFDSHDGLFHVYRLAALDGAVRAGVPYPRWFPSFAFGYGQPVLNFYGPLAYYWGLPFTLIGVDAVPALKLIFATGLVASALAMYLFARLHLQRLPSLVAAVVYVYLPYHLVDLYVRGAVAEFVAFVWFPLVLWAFHRLVANPGPFRFASLGLASLLLAALTVTHSLSALLFAPVIVGYVVVLLWQRRDLSALGRTALAAALAIAVSASYWLPVLVESRYVGLGHGTSQGYREHLLPPSDLVSLSPTYGYPDAGVAPTYHLGMIQVALLVASLILLLAVRPRRWLALFFLVVALASAFMLATSSLPAWQLLEGGLAFLQYPWRFLSITVLATAFLTGLVIQAVADISGRSGTVAGLALLLATSVWALWHLPVTPTAPDLSVEAMWRMDREFGQVGTTWTGEYLPVWVTEQRWAISHPTPDSGAGRPTVGAGQLQLTDVGYTRMEFSLDAPQGASLALHQFHYPGWEATWQGDQFHSNAKGALGLASFDLPAGSGALRVRLGLTPAQLWGTLISLVATLVSSVLLVAEFVRSRASVRPIRQPAKRFAPLALAACYLLLSAILLGSLVLPNGRVQAVQPISANLEGKVELLAYAKDSARYAPGETVSVALYWLALHGPEQDYKTFVHLTDADFASQPAQHDGDPGGGFSPTTRWLPGEIVPDTHHLVLPKDLAPGRYLLWAGMYVHETVRNLAVLSADVPTVDGRVLLGEIEVEAP